MVALKGGNGRWLRKYKIFFFIGVLILLFQIFLAANFLDLSKNNTHDDWQPQSINSPTKHTKTEQQKTVLTTNATNLRVEELSFKPACEINTKEAISAIHRAKTQKCKQYIANVFCLGLAEDLYPKYLSGHCPVEGKTKGHALGCFKDENNFRLLTGYLGVNKKSNSAEYCTELCLQSGFEYAGVEYANECFCGNEEPSVKHKLPDSSCNMKCPGNNHATCGGYYTINVYETGINKFVPQVANTELITTNEDDVRIVFLLTINGRALRQVKRLIKLLYNQRHYYYIHVDVREDYLFRELLYLETRFPNIRLSRRRFATIWGGASLLEMLLSCMNDLLNTPSWHWDFILNLSESDYPVKLPSALQRFLSANRDHNFVKSHGRDTQRFLQKQGLDKTFVECEMRMWRVADRKLPKGLQMDGGSDWVALSRKFVEYVAAQEPDELVAGLIQVFKYTLLPAESFFHTVLRNSHFCNTYIDNNLHVTNWKRKLGCKCQYKHVVDWCGCSPNDFRLDDWTRIQSTQSRQLFFARKFEPIINQAILLKLELWLFNLEKPSKKVLNLHSYWQSMYHHLDLSPTIDDGFKTLLHSIRRLWIQTTNCTKESLKTIITASSYHSKDLYEATLIHFILGEDENIEIGFSPIEHTYLISPSSLAKRFDDITITSDFDQKEQISRNWARNLSPFSEPLLVYKLRSDEGSIVHNISCLWINPTGVLLDVSDISLDENAGIGYSKPSLKQPHLPGVWTVKIIQQQLLIAEMKFLIIPLEFYRGNTLNSRQAPLVNGRSSSSTVIENYDKFLGNNFNEKKLRTSSIINSYKTGEELQNWIDSLVDKFYKINKVCAIMKKSQQKNFCGVVNECIETSWSSFAPDPKSATGNINQTSGMFDIW